MRISTSGLSPRQEAPEPRTSRLARRALLAGLPALLLAHMGSARAEDDVRYFRIGTAATAGTYFQIGGMLANAISKPPGSRECGHGGGCGVPDLIAVAQATQGSVENVMAVAAGRLESALAQSDIAYWAETGTGLFKGDAPLINLRAIAALYPESAHVVVAGNGPIRSLGDLKGKRVGLGEKESGTIVDARLILDAAGMAERDVKADYRSLSLAAQGLAQGELDAFFLFGGYPVPAIAELATTSSVRLLPVAGDVADRLLARYRFFSRDTIPADTYSGVTMETPTISAKALWIVSTEVPDDLVYAITGALWRDANRRLLDLGHPMGKRITLATALDGLVLHLHPGALRFYREAGMAIPDDIQ